MSELTSEALKIGGTLLATVAAVLSTVLEDVKSRDSRKLTAKGRVLVGISIVGFLIAAGSQLGDYYATAESFRETAERNERTAKQMQATLLAISRQATLHRMSLVCLLSPDVKVEDLAGPEDLSLDLSFWRGSAVEVSFMTSPGTVRTGSEPLT